MPAYGGGHKRTLANHLNTFKRSRPYNRLNPPIVYPLINELFEKNIIFPIMRLGTAVALLFPPLVVTGYVRIQTWLMTA